MVLTTAASRPRLRLPHLHVSSHDVRQISSDLAHVLHGRAGVWLFGLACVALVCVFAAGWHRGSQ